MFYAWFNVEEVGYVIRSVNESKLDNEGNFLVIGCFERKRSVIKSSKKQ